MEFGTYNIAFESPNSPGKTMVFNTLSKCCVELDNEIISSLQTGSATHLTDEEMNVLRSGLIIVQDREHERNLLKYSMNVSRFGNASMHLNIYTTFHCNFSCPYCYENASGTLRSGDMGEETAESLLAWLERFISGRALSLLQVRLYGGEPLCNMDRVSQLCVGLRRICNENGVDLQSYVITNGSLIDDSILDTLSGINLNMVQITLDGPQTIHDKMRPFLDGQGTYEVIMRNLEKVLSRNLTVMIRTNVNKDTIEQAKGLIDDMSGRGLVSGRNVYLELASIYTEDWDSQCGVDTCLDAADYDALRRVKMHAISRGFRIRNPFFFDQCFALAANNFEITPTGDLFSCTSFVGRSKFCLGNVSEAGFRPIYFEMMAHEPYDDECVRCPYIPICMGGCRAQVAMETGTIGSKKCNRENLKNITVDGLKVYYSQGWVYENS